MMKHTQSDVLVYRIAEAAQKLQISRTTLYNLILSKRIKVVKVGPRGLRIAAAELDRFLHSAGE